MSGHPQLTPTIGVLPLNIVAFTAENRSRYLAWDLMRHDIFAGELGWSLPRRNPGAAALSDPFDRHATFLTAEVQDRPIGIVRALVAADGFPHRELFEHHIQQMGLDARLSRLGTLNALAVIPEQRRQCFDHRSAGDPATAATLLLKSALHHFSVSGVRFIFATVLSARSARVFLRVGFRLLDRPVTSQHDNRFRLANVGRVLSPDTAVETRSGVESLVAAYFEHRHQEVMALGSLEELFAIR